MGAGVATQLGKPHSFQGTEEGELVAAMIPKGSAGGSSCPRISGQGRRGGRRARGCGSAVVGAHKGWAGAPAVGLCIKALHGNRGFRPGDQGHCRVISRR